MGLVGKVIQDKVHRPYQNTFYSYEDLFQIGCIGLCKAAATDKGGCFSTYAYKLIWNEICDALIYASRRQENELLSCANPIALSVYDSLSSSNLSADLSVAIEKVRSSASPSIARGIDAFMLRWSGYSSAEVGSKMSLSENSVRALISRARKHLNNNSELRSLHL